MPPQVRTTGQSFGKTLFKGLGQVLANAPQVIQAQKQHQQAQMIEQFKLQLLAIQEQRRQQESKHNILRLTSISRLNDIRREGLAGSFLSPDEEAALKVKTEGLISTNKANAFSDFIGSQKGKDLVTGLGGRGFTIPGVGGINNRPSLGRGGLSGNAAFIKEMLGEEEAIKFILTGVNKTPQEIAISFIQSAINNPFLSGGSNPGRFGLRKDFLDNVTSFTGVDVNTLELPAFPPTNNQETDDEARIRLEAEIDVLEEKIKAGKGQ